MLIFLEVLTLSLKQPNALTSFDVHILRYDAPSEAVTDDEGPQRD